MHAQRRHEAIFKVAHLLRLSLLVIFITFISSTSFAAGSPADIIDIHSLQEMASKGNVSAQIALGRRYETGQNVTQDYIEALKWYHKAANQGDTVAQGSIGDMYFNGRGVPTDYTEAMNWYRKAADQGDAAGQGIVGYMYEQGLGVAQDYTEAAKRYHKAGSQGNAMAQAFLGKLYGEGKGVTQDYAEAYFWLNLASTIGYTKFVVSRDHVAEKLPPDALLAVQRRALYWKPG